MIKFSMLNCVARGGAVQAFENFGLPMNLIERFVRHAVAETTGTGAIVRYVQILFGSSPNDF
jgi:hypothetical protein